MTGETALVTGAGLRLGRAIARALAREGYRVAAHYNTSRGAAEVLVAEIKADGGEAVALGRDLSADVGASGKLLDDAADALGPVSLLVNSASHYEGDSLETLSLDSWQRISSVNATAPILLMQAFAGQAKRGGTIPKGASIINLLDVQLAAPSPQYFSYFCAKAALEAATRMAALELAPDIRVNAIAPGLVLQSGGQSEAAFTRRQAQAPLGVGLGAEDIVNAVLYLANASHVTGQIIAVDSGQQLLGFGNSTLR